MQSNRSILGIRLLIGVLPGIFILIANIVLAVYPLTRNRYEQILEKIRKMEAEIAA
jgi:Na+/melibiose symporter-like transporter